MPYGVRNGVVFVVPKIHKSNGEDILLLQCECRTPVNQWRLVGLQGHVSYARYGLTIATFKQTARGSIQSVSFVATAWLFLRWSFTRKYVLAMAHRFPSWPGLHKGCNGSASKEGSAGRDDGKEKRKAAGLELEMAVR